MELSNSPDIFQEKMKMNELFNGLEYVRAYIDLLIISNGNIDDLLIISYSNCEECFKDTKESCFQNQFIKIIFRQRSWFQNK